MWEANVKCVCELDCFIGVLKCLTQCVFYMVYFGFETQLDLALCVCVWVFHPLGVFVSLQLCSVSALGSVLLVITCTSACHHHARPRLTVTVCECQPVLVYQQLEFVCLYLYPSFSAF